MVAELITLPEIQEAARKYQRIDELKLLTASARALRNHKPTKKKKVFTELVAMAEE